MSIQRSALGLIVATPGAVAAMSNSESDGFEYLARKAQRDWGEVSTEDQRGNQLQVSPAMLIQ